MGWMQVLFSSCWQQWKQSEAKFACALISANHKPLTNSNIHALPSSSVETSLSFNSCICKWMKSHSHMSHMGLGIDRAFFLHSSSLFCCRCSAAAIDTQQKKGVKFHRLIFAFFFFFSLRTNEFIMCVVPVRVCVFGELVAFGIDLLPTKTSNTRKMNNRDHRRMQNVKKKTWFLLRLSCCETSTALPPNYTLFTVTHTRCHHRRRWHSQIHCMSRQLPWNQMPSFAHGFCSRSHFSSFIVSIRARFIQSKNQRLSTSD